MADEGLWSWPPPPTTTTTATSTSASTSGSTSEVEKQTKFWKNHFRQNDDGRERKRWTKGRNKDTDKKDIYEKEQKMVLQMRKEKGARERERMKKNNDISKQKKANETES